MIKTPAGAQDRIIEYISEELFLARIKPLSNKQYLAFHAAWQELEGKIFYEKKHWDELGAYTSDLLKMLNDAFKKDFAIWFSRTEKFRLCPNAPPEVEGCDDPPDTLYTSFPPALMPEGFPTWMTQFSKYAFFD